MDGERARLAAREQEVAAERRRLESEGLKEQREKVRELERKLESLLRDFEYHARESVNAIQDRAESLQLSREAERRIAKARREFREQFNQSIVAHTSGADRDDPNAEPHRVQHVSEGDTVQLKSLGAPVRSRASFRPRRGSAGWPDEGACCHGRHRHGHRTSPRSPCRRRVRRGSRSPARRG